MSSASSSAAGGGSGATMTSHSAAAAASQGHTTAVTHDTQDSISAPPSPASSQDKTPQNEVKNLKRVMNFWKEFDLPKKQEELVWNGKSLLDSSANVLLSLCLFLLCVCLLTEYLCH